MFITDIARLPRIRILVGDSCGGKTARDAVKTGGKKLRALGRRPTETLLHRAADSHVPKLSVALRYAFAVARKVLRGQPKNVNGAVKAFRHGLKEVLPATLRKAMIAGGEAGVEMLGKRLKVAGDVEGHEFHGNQWTAGVTSKDVTPQEQDVAKELGLPTTYHGEDSEHRFAGLAVDNPLPQSKVLTHEQAKRLSIMMTGSSKDVDVSSLRSTQDYVQPSAVKHYKDGLYMKSQPIVATIHGEEILLNGNHNVLAAKLQGKTTISVQHLGDFTEHADYIKEVDAKLRTKRIRTAGDVEGHEFHGNQWTEGSGEMSALFRVPENFKLEDAEYDVNTKLPLDTMVVASVDLDLLSSSYRNDFRVKEMTSAIKQGVKLPALTLEQKKDGSLSVLDGQTRVAAFRESGIKGRVPAVIRLYDKGTESSLPKGAVIDSKRTSSLRGEKLRTAKQSDVPTLRFRFDAKNQNVIDRADKHAAELIDNISETTREQINNAIAEALESGNFDEALDEILDAVGDERRADLIARHETMLAASEGQREAWDQAVDAGLLTGDEKRTWIVVGDEKVCPICEELDGTIAELGGEYPGGYDGPPAHVACRCTEGLTS